MGIFKYVLAVAMTILTFSCESWLDVSPQAELKEDDQFSTEQGFKDAVYGVYTKLASPALYGDNLSMGMLSALGNDYYYSGIYSGPLQSLITYDFEADNSKTYFEEIWNEMYNAIAHVNYVLRNVDERRDVLSDEVYSTVKGEMLGLRAYLHFDLFRMYTPTYTTANVDSAYIPYRDAFDVQLASPLSMRNFASKIQKDIDDALVYLAEYQEIDQLNTYIDYEGDRSEDFLLYRQNRFNYYACKALEARYNMWIGDMSKAAAAANEVINSNKFHFITTAEANATGNAKDQVFTPELIFALYDSDLKDRADEYFTETNNTLLEYRLPTQSSYLRYDLFDVYGGGSSDIRYLKQFTAPTDVYTFTTKYVQDESVDDAIRNQIPLIRLGEMYLIVAEATSSPDFVNQLQSARALTPDVTADNLVEKIRNEFAKETYAEGQLFFMYKRHGLEAINYRTAQYTFSIPDDELIYGGY